MFFELVRNMCPKVLQQINQPIPSRLYTRREPEEGGAKDDFTSGDVTKDVLFVGFHFEFRGCITSSKWILPWIYHEFYGCHTSSSFWSCGHIISLPNSDATFQLPIDQQVTRTGTRESHVRVTADVITFLRLRGNWMYHFVNSHNLENGKIYTIYLV